jgi:hypothetical protein
MEAISSIKVIRSADTLQAFLADFLIDKVRFKVYSIVGILRGLAPIEVFQMKSTDIERRNRDLKRSQKKAELLEKRSSRENRSVGDFINAFVELFFYDAEKIYNLEMSDEILFLLEEMKEEQPEKQWENIITKAVKKTKVKAKDEAIAALKDIAEI